MDMRYDPFSPAVRENPYPYYEELRQHAPVHQVEGAGLFVVSRFDDVVFVVKHPELFSSAPMNFQSAREGLFSAGAATIIGSDPPAHTRLRSLVNRGFTPRRIANLEPRIRAICDELVASLRGRQEFDLTADLSIPLPVIVIAELLGVEAERRSDFKRWSDSIVTVISGSPTEEESALLRPNMKAFRDYFEEVVVQRRESPKDDLISVLVRAQEAEQALSAEDVVAFAALLLVAGNETTTNLIGNGVLALLNHPAELEKVRSDRGLVPNLIEEILRYDGPVQGLFRMTTQELELAGKTIPAGAIVMPLFASADRDERKFPDPNRFDIARPVDGHVAFGFGIHFCLGAALARLEARVVLEALLFDLPPFVRTTDRPVEYINSIFLRGPKSLPLLFE